MSEPAFQPDDRLYIEIRARAAFECMLVAVLTTALVSGAAAFLLEGATTLVRAGLSISVLARAALVGIAVLATVFLSGFFASVAVGAPLFLALEKARMRKSWPYMVGALAVAFVTIWLVVGFPFDPDAPHRLLYFLPALLIAGLFARGMRPRWRAAERAESQRTLVTLH
jgi:hypothetical protein